MYTRNKKEFAVWVELHWLLLSDWFFELQHLFCKNIEKEFNNTAKSHVKEFKCAQKCRFSIMFEEKRGQPNATEKRLMDVVGDTLTALQNKHGMKSKKIKILSNVRTRNEKNSRSIGT